MSTINNNEIYKSKLELQPRMCVVSYSSFVCISAYANVYFKSLLRECLRAALPSDFPSIAPPPVCVLAVLGTLAVCIPIQKKKNFFDKGWRFLLVIVSAATQLAHQIHQQRTQVVWSNMVVRKHLGRRHSCNLCHLRIRIMVCACSRHALEFQILFFGSFVKQNGYGVNISWGSESKILHGSLGADGMVF